MTMQMTFSLTGEPPEYYRTIANSSNQWSMNSNSDYSNLIVSGGSASRANTCDALGGSSSGTWTWRTMTSDSSGSYIPDGQGGAGSTNQPYIQQYDPYQQQIYPQVYPGTFIQQPVPVDEKMVEQMVERILIERMKQDKDKGPEDLIFLMKTCGFQKEMIDIVRNALRRDWPISKESQERLETLIYGE
jgi:hypothetical protein